MFKRRCCNDRSIFGTSQGEEEVNDLTGYLPLTGGTLSGELVADTIVKIVGDLQYNQNQIEGYSDTSALTEIKAINTWTPCNFTAFTTRTNAEGFTFDTNVKGELITNFTDRQRWCQIGVTMSCGLDSGSNLQLSFGVFRVDNDPLYLGLNKIPGSEVEVFIGSGLNETQNLTISCFTKMISPQKYRLFVKNLTTTDDISIKHVTWFVLATPNLAL